MRHPVNDLFPKMEDEAAWAKALQIYLDDGGDPNAPNVFLSSPHLGKTMLIRAIELNKVGMVRKLLEAKANPNVTHNKTAQSPLSYALITQSPTPETTNIIKFLLDAGADVDRVDEFTNMSPLYHFLSTPIPYNSQHVLIVRLLFSKNAISSFKSHPNYVIGESTDLDTPRTVNLHMNPAFVLLSNDKQPITNEFYAVMTFIVKKSLDKGYIQLYNFFPGDKASRSLDKFNEFTFLNQLVMCNNRVYPFTPLTYLFTPHCKTLPLHSHVSYITENSDATLHPDAKQLIAMEKLYKEYLAENKILSHSRPNAPGVAKDRAAGIGQGVIIPDPKLVYQTYCDMGFTVLNNILSHPSPYDENTITLVNLLFEKDGFKTHYKRWVYYNDAYVQGYFDYKAVESYKKLKAVNPDGNSSPLLYDPAHEERHSLPNRIVLNEKGHPEYITEIDSDQELFVVELKSDPFFINVNNMCSAYSPASHRRKTNIQLLQAHLHHGSFYKETIFFPNGVGEFAMVHGSSSNGVGNGASEDDDGYDNGMTPDSQGMIHRPFDEHFNSIYELLLSHTISLHLTKEQFEVGRELMAAQHEDEEKDKKKKEKETKNKKRDKLLSHSDAKGSTENHNYMYRASGALLLAIRGRSQPNVNFIEYLVHIHHATTTISMYSFHNIFLWLLSSCQDLELVKFRYLLSLLLDEAGCDVLSVKYQQRIHQLTQKPLNAGEVGQYGEHSVNENSRIGMGSLNSRSHQNRMTASNLDSVNQVSSLTSPTGGSNNNMAMEESVSKKGSRSLFSRFTSIFQSGPSSLVSKTLARQYSFDYFSLVLLYCLTSPRTTTYLYIYTLITTLNERLVTHQSQLSMSLVVSRDGFRTFNRDHIHSQTIEYFPMFNSDSGLLEKKHVANHLFTYYLVYGNLRLHAAQELFTFLLKAHPFKQSAYHPLMKAVTALLQEQYLTEYKDDQHHHNKASITNYHDDIKKYKVNRFGNRALDTESQNSAMTKHFDNEDEEERLMLELKLNPRLLLSPRSPLLTESGSQFFELLIQEFWTQEIKQLRQQYPYDESALIDSNNNKNAQYNEAFTTTLTNFITTLLNTTIFSPQDGVWLYKIVDKFLAVARPDILSQRQELNSKLQSGSQTTLTAIAPESTNTIVNLDATEHSTNMALFTHHRGADYAYKIDCTRLFHTPIPFSTDVVKALTSLLADQYNIILVYYQQYYNHIAISPYAYHIFHSVLENPPSEELPTAGLGANSTGQDSLGLPTEAPQRHTTIIIDDDEDVDQAQMAKGVDAGGNHHHGNNQQSANNRSGSKSAADTNNKNNHDDHTAEQTAAAQTTLIGGHWGRFSLAPDPYRKITEYDPASTQSVIDATYASTIEQIELTTRHIQLLRGKKVESFMRYRGALPAVYGLLRASSQQALTPTWFRLFDLLVAQCKDFFSIAQNTRTSPLSIFLFSCFVFDTHSLAVAKWLLQPPISSPGTSNASNNSSNDSTQRPKLTKVADLMQTQLTPPPTPLRYSIASNEYQQRQLELAKAGEGRHFDYVEALYALVTAPAHRHNQVYKTLLEKMLLFIHPDDLNLFSFDPNGVLTQQELQQQQLTYHQMFQQHNMNKSIVSQYLSHLSSPTQMSIDILHLLLRAGGKVHLANPTTNQSPLIYFVQQQTHQQFITQEFFDIFKLLFSNYGHCGVLLLTTEHRTLFELALNHVRVMDAICVEYLLFLLSTSHIAYRHALAYQDVMGELALLERNKNKRLMAPILAVDRQDGLWSRTHKLIDSAWVEPTGHTLFSQFQNDNGNSDDDDDDDDDDPFDGPKLRRHFVPSRLSREDFSTLFDFYYSSMYLPPNARFYSVVHALANHRDQHIVATIFGNVPNHESFLYYSSDTRDATLKSIVIAALTARRRELNNTLNFTINLQIVDCIDNVEPIQLEEIAPKPSSGGNKSKPTGLLFQRQQLDSATPSTAPAIPEWATALGDTMHLNFTRKRQQKTVRDGTEGLLWYIINNVQNPRTEDIVTMLDGCFDDATGTRLSTPVSMDYVNFNNETPLMHAILRRWDENTLIYMINKAGPLEVLKQRDNNGRTAYDYMVACVTHVYAPDAVALLAEARK